MMIVILACKLLILLAAFGCSDGGGNYGLFKLARLALKVLLASC